MVDEFCKEVETRRFPSGAKRGGKKEDSTNPSSCPRSKRMFGFSPNRTSSGHIDEEASISLMKKRNEENTKIHEVECKSLQGDCMEEEKEGECTSKIFGVDLQINEKDVGSWMGEETYFGSDTK